jgi:hypothetical protein
LEEELEGELWGNKITPLLLPEKASLAKLLLADDVIASPLLPSALAELKSLTARIRASPPSASRGLMSTFLPTLPSSLLLLDELFESPWTWLQ